MHKHKGMKGGLSQMHLCRVEVCTAVCTARARDLSWQEGQGRVAVEERTHRPACQCKMLGTRAEWVCLRNRAIKIEHGAEKLWLQARFAISMRAGHPILMTGDGPV